MCIVVSFVLKTLESFPWIIVNTLVNFTYIKTSYEWNNSRMKNVILHCKVKKIPNKKINICTNHKPVPGIFYCSS
jgi:hypothetical protein